VTNVTASGCGLYALREICHSVILPNVLNKWICHLLRPFVYIISGARSLSRNIDCIQWVDVDCVVFATLHILMSLHNANYKNTSMPIKRKNVNKNIWCSSIFANLTNDSTSEKYEVLAQRGLRGILTKRKNKPQ